MIVAVQSPRARVNHEELIHRIDQKTHWQIRNLHLEVDEQDRRIRVTGRSRTYYTKQLVTHAVQAARPEYDLDNAIHVTGH